MKGAIFDFNGTTILDDLVQKESWIAFVSGLVGYQISEKDYYDHIYATINSDCFSYWLKREVSREETESLGAIKERMYRELCILRKDEVTLVHGFERFLNRLVKDGVAVNIATSAPLDNMQFAFGMYQLYRWFDYGRMVYDDGTIKGKPEPDIYVKAVRNLKLEGKDCIAFEDSINGAKAALRADISEVYLVDAFHKFEQSSVEIEGKTVEIFRDFNEVYDRIYSDGSNQQL